MIVLNGELKKTFRHCNFDLEKSLILLGYRGSITHGTYVPKHLSDSIDDKDVMGICIPPIEYYFGLQKFEQYEQFEGEWDVVIYSIQKMFNLLLKNNPNVLSLLWLPERHYILKTEIGEEIIKNRDLFLSKLCYKSYSGYAYGQLHRMTHGAKQGYMGEKRKNLVEKYGYDCKNASHLIRLLYMGIETLISGEILVERTEKQMLIEIKRGLWKLEDIKKLADKLFDDIRIAYITSKLPDKPNYKKIEELLIHLTKKYQQEKR